MKGTTVGSPAFSGTCGLEVVRFEQDIDPTKLEIGDDITSLRINDRRVSVEASLEPGADVAKFLGATVLIQPLDREGNRRPSYFPASLLDPRTPTDTQIWASRSPLENRADIRSRRATAEASAGSFFAPFAIGRLFRPHETGFLVLAENGEVIVASRFLGPERAPTHLTHVLKLETSLPTDSD